MTARPGIKALAGLTALVAIVFLLSPTYAEGQMHMKNMNDTLQGLEPGPLWEHFLAISRIPRCSHNEEKVRDYVLEVADRNGCAHETDPTGNTVVRKKATPGLESRPGIVLQAHLDMVCEKNRDTAHDFSRDPIRWKRDGGWLGAEGTTLGADNGIGVAAQLALIEAKDVVHGPLEFLFTVDEETGLMGATGLAPGMLGGRTLINLDSEDEHTIYIGCAGGQETVLTLPHDTEAVPAGYTAASVRVGGLQGGHSGVEIDRGRGNAIKLLSRFLARKAPLLQARVAHIDGGSKRNAIPRESEVVVCLPPGNLEALKKAVREFEQVCREELRARDPGASLWVSEDGFPAPDQVFRAEFQDRLLDLLGCLPHGVITMSPDIPGLVQTSTNLAVITTDEGAITISTSQRSSVATELVTASDMVAAAGRLAGAHVHHGEGYPGWKPNPDSPILGQAMTVYPSLFGKEPNVTAIHAGLECGIIGDRFPGMDMISFGPTITGAHSLDERVDVASVKRFWEFLVAMLERGEGS
jgi:dipeptidase D